MTLMISTIHSLPVKKAPAVPKILAILIFRANLGLRHAFFLVTNCLTAMMKKMENIYKKMWPHFSVFA